MTTDKFFAASNKAPDHIHATMITDTINPDTKVRLSTIQITFPRIILAEYNTHKIIIKNFSSSRAIPAKKLRAQVLENPYIPIYWGANQRGMSAEKELTGFAKSCARFAWKAASKMAVFAHWALEKCGVHKQTCNRLIEPFLTVTGVTTASNWENFFKLRISKLAQPEIEELAKCIKAVLDSSEPRVATDKDPFHFPYLTDEDKEKTDYQNWYKVSSARCCRASYNNLGTLSPIDKDINLSDRLMGDEHYSPFEQLAIKVPTDREARRRLFEFLDQWKIHLPNLSSAHSQLIRCIYLQRNYVGPNGVATEVSGWMMVRAFIDPFEAKGYSNDELVEIKQQFLNELFYYFKNN